VWNTAAPAGVLGGLAILAAVSAERLRVLDEAYDAWNAADFERWSKLWDEDIVYDVSSIFWDQHQIEGREMMARWARAVLRTWAGFRMELLDTLEVTDERIVQRVRMRTTARHTGLDMDQEVFQVFEYANGPLPVRGSLTPARPS
jgi:ketosteroid isomerase-like protein